MDGDSGGKGRVQWTQHIRVQWKAKGYRGSPGIEKRRWGCQDKTKGMQRVGWALSKLLDSPRPSPHLLPLQYPAPTLSALAGGLIPGLCKAGGHHIMETPPCLLEAHSLTGSWTQEQKWRGTTTTWGDWCGWHETRDTGVQMPASIEGFLA